MTRKREVGAVLSRFRHRSRSGWQPLTPSQEVERVNNGLISVATGPIDPAIAVSMIGDIVVLSPRGGSTSTPHTRWCRPSMPPRAPTARSSSISTDRPSSRHAELLFRTGITPPNGIPMPVTHPTIGVIAPGCVRLSSSRGTGRSISANAASAAVQSPSTGASSASTTGPASATCGRQASALRSLTTDDTIISTATPWVAGVRAA